MTSCAAVNLDPHSKWPSSASLDVRHSCPSKNFFNASKTSKKAFCKAAEETLDPALLQAEECLAAEELHHPLHVELRPKERLQQASEAHQLLVNLPHQLLLLRLRHHRNNQRHKDPNQPLHLQRPVVCPQTLRLHHRP